MKRVIGMVVVLAALSTGCVKPGCHITDLVEHRERIEALPFAQREAEYQKVRDFCDRPHWAEPPTARGRRSGGFSVTCTSWTIGDSTTISCN